MKHERFAWVDSTTAADHPVLKLFGTKITVQHRFVVGTSCCGVTPLFSPARRVSFDAVEKSRGLGRHDLISIAARVRKSARSVESSRRNYGI